MFTSELKLITGLINDHNEQYNAELAKVLVETEPFTDEFYIKALPIATDAYKDLAEVAKRIKQAFGIVATFKPEKKIAFELMEEMVTEHLKDLNNENVPDKITKGAMYHKVIKHYSSLMFGIGNVAEELEEKMEEML